MKQSWYSRKVIGKLRYRSHPDNKRDRLNKRGMNKLNKLKKMNWELYLEERPNSLLIFKALLIPWKWKLTILSPGGMGKRCVGWRFILDQRYGKVRKMILGYPKKDPGTRGLGRLRLFVRRTLREFNFRVK